MTFERIRWYNKLEYANKRLEFFSYHDQLTNLFNRRGFMLNGDKIFEENKDNLYLFYIDLDGLKKINDTYGHNEGDFAIISISDALNSSCPAKTIISRIGGDEFTILFCGEDDSVNEIKNNSFSYLDNLNLKANKPYKISVSIGIAKNEAGKFTSFESLMHEADRLLYINKQKKSLVS